MNWQTEELKNICITMKKYHIFWHLLFYNEKGEARHFWLPDNHPFIDPFEISFASIYLQNYRKGHKNIWYTVHQLCEQIFQKVQGTIHNVGKTYADICLMDQYRSFASQTSDLYSIIYGIKSLYFMSCKVEKKDWDIQNLLCEAELIKNHEDNIIDKDLIFLVIGTKKTRYIKL